MDNEPRSLGFSFNQGNEQSNTTGPVKEGLCSFCHNVCRLRRLERAWTPCPIALNNVAQVG